MWAAERGFLAVVTVLVKAGADKEKQDQVRPGYYVLGYLQCAFLKSS
jgi:hypothetical protein